MGCGVPVQQDTAAQSGQTRCMVTVALFKMHSPSPRGSCRGNVQPTSVTPARAMCLCLQFQGASWLAKTQNIFGHMWDMQSTCLCASSGEICRSPRYKKETSLSVHCVLLPWLQVQELPPTFPSSKKRVGDVDKHLCPPRSAKEKNLPFLATQLLSTPQQRG